MRERLLRAGTIKRLHVNRHIMSKNARTGSNEPALAVQTSAGPIRARCVRIKGEAVLVQSQKPLPCGARAWIETRGAVEVSMQGR